MITGMEMELRDARGECEDLMEALRFSGRTRFFASEERAIFLDGLNYLLNTIDEIENLLVGAKNLIREARGIRAMLFYSGFRVCSPKLVQTISNESAISEQLLLIQERMNNKVTRIGKLMRNYNDYQRELIEIRVAGQGRLRMSLGGIPGAEYFPLPLSVYLLSELYEAGHSIRRSPDPIVVKRNLSGGNGNGLNGRSE